MQIHHTLNLKIESKLQSPKVLKSNIHRRHISQMSHKCDILMSHKCDILIPIFHVCAIEVNLLFNKSQPAPSTKEIFYKN